MKKIISILILILLTSCGANKNTPKALFEVLYEDAYGGAKIEFYETITEKSEINMLLNNENLKGKIKKKDIETVNFVILNMGEKPSDGYSISVDKIVETADSIVVSVKLKEPKPRQKVVQEYTNPYCIVKINSKKEIVFK